MQKPSLKERFSYWFDHYMSKGTGALVALQWAHRMHGFGSHPHD